MCSRTRGSPANQAVYLALAKPGEAVMGLDCRSAAISRTGWGVEFLRHSLQVVAIRREPDTHRVDLNKVEEPREGDKPKLIFCGGTAYPRTWDYAGFAEIAKEGRRRARRGHRARCWLDRGGAHPHPYPHGEDHHDHDSQTLRGPRAA